MIVDECHRSIYGALAAGARLLRRVHDRADGDAEQADVRVLQPEPRDGVHPRAGRRRRRSTSTSTSTASAPRSPSRARTIDAGLVTAVPRPPDARSCAGRQLDEDVAYGAETLDRAVVAEDQIRTVIRTFKERLFTEIFPGRTEVPKTLIFAKDDSHADDIVQIVREEFGKGNDFAVKITYKSTGRKPDELIAAFRNSLQPADRRDRRHDRHRHRRAPARVRVLHALGQEPHLLRADEGPRRARHQRGRLPGGHPRRAARRAAS